MSHGLIGAPASLFCCHLWITLHHILLLVSFVPSSVFVITCFVSFHALSDDLLQFGAWRIVIPSFHPYPIPWTLVRKSLVERVILLERVHVHQCLRVYLFITFFSLEFICWHSENAQVKRKEKKKKKKERKKWRKKRRKEKNKHMYVWIQCLSPLSVCIVVEIHLNEFILLWVFVCELLKVLISFCLSCYVCYVWETSDHFPTDSRLLSFPSFHTYVIWLFSMF